MSRPAEPRTCPADGRTPRAPAPKPTPAPPPSPSAEPATETDASSDPLRSPPRKRARRDTAPAAPGDAYTAGDEPAQFEPNTPHPNPAWPDPTEASHSTTAADPPAPCLRCPTATRVLCLCKARGNALRGPAARELASSGLASYGLAAQGFASYGLYAPYGAHAADMRDEGDFAADEPMA